MYVRLYTETVFFSINCLCLWTNGKVVLPYIFYFNNSILWQVCLILSSAPYKFQERLLQPIPHPHSVKLILVVIWPLTIVGIKKEQRLLINQFNNSFCLEEIPIWIPRNPSKYEWIGMWKEQQCLHWFSFKIQSLQVSNLKFLPIIFKLPKIVMELNLQN